VSEKKRKRDIPLFVWLSQEEHDAIIQRMEKAGTQNLSAYIRKMAMDGYVVNVDLAPVRELVSLQRRCSNNLNQVAIHANSYGVYQEEITGLQRDYKKMWGRVADVLKYLTEVVEL